MIQKPTGYSNAVSAPRRSIKAKVELYKGSTLIDTFTQGDAIKSISIDRVGEDSKFFGIGICHKLNLSLTDVKRLINITTENHLKVYIGVVMPDDSVDYTAFPKMYVTEVNRDENTNELTISAFDKLKDTTAHTVGELVMPTADEEDLPGYTIRDFVEACGNLLGLTVSIPVDIEPFNLEYENGANFEGTENIQSALVAAAEATQTIYYINGYDVLVFKRLDVEGDSVKTISKSDYFTLEDSSNIRLRTICHATELGDNVSASTTLPGETQYVRDNPFWELRDDIGTIVENAVAAVGNMEINQFNLEWRGDPAVEIGDKISLVTKNYALISSYVLNDTLTFEGGLSQTTQWNYTKTDETASNPSSLGEMLKQTYAKVDKTNKEITMLTREVNGNTENISNINLNTNSILASVQQIETNTKTSIDGLQDEINTMAKKVEAAVTAEDIQLVVKSEMSEGVNKVTTETGFTFDETGLTVEKTGSEMKTQITEDGMKVHRNDTEVLTANNKGVTAYNLHARTYLIVGLSSRFEDYEKDGSPRTGCFWIGETGV